MSYNTKYHADLTCFIAKSGLWQNSFVKLESISQETQTIPGMQKHMH